MKKWKKIYYTLFSILITIPSINGQSTDSLTSARILILDSLRINTKNNQKEIDLNIKLSKNYFESKNFKKSISVLNKIPIFLASTDQQQQIIFYQSLNSFFLTNYTECLQKCAQWRPQKNNYFQNKNILLIKILALNQVHSFDSALYTSTLYIDTFTEKKGLKDSLTFLVKKLYKKIPKIKSSEKAQWIGTFIPGGGIIYAGKPAEGLFSFTLQAASLSYAIWEFYHQNYVTGYVAGLGLLQKFYFGSLKRTSLITKQKNSEKIHKFNANLIMVLKSI